MRKVLLLLQNVLSSSCVGLDGGESAKKANESVSTPAAATGTQRELPFSGTGTWTLVFAKVLTLSRYRCRRSR